MYTLEQEPTVGLSRGFVFEYCPSPSPRSSPAFLKDNEVFHAPCFGDDDFDLESLTTCKSSTKFSAQTTQHSIQPAAYTMSQAQGNMDLSQPSANQSGMSILETLERLAPKFPPQDFDVPDISVTNSDLFSSSINNIRLHSPTVPHVSNASILSNISASVGGTNQGVSIGFQNHTGVSSPTSTGSNMTVSPLRESSEDSDDCLPLAQLAIKRQAQDDPVPESKGAKKPRTPKKRKKKDPNEPQKPVSAYALFFRDTQAAIKGQNSTASFGEVSKIVASMWEGLDPEHKNVYKKKTEVAKKEYLKQLAAYRASLVSQTTFDDQGHNEVSSSPPRLSPHRMTAASLSSPDVQLGMMTDMSPPHPQVYGMESPRHQGVMGALSPPHPALQNGSSPPHMKYGNGSPQYTIMDSPSHVMSQPLQQQGMVTYHHQSPQHSLSYSSPLHGDLSPVSAEVHSLSHYPVIAPRPSSHMRHQQPQSMPSSGGILAPGMCIRNGCTNRAIDNVGWDSEYCSNECVVSHCRDVFTAWVAARQVTGNSYIIK